MMKYLCCVFFLFNCGSIFSQPQQINPLWQRQEATNGGPDAYTPLILIDSFHNVIACGSTYTPGPATGFITFKYDPDGNKLWERRHQTPATDFITAAATDWEGAVYVAGVTINAPFGGAGNQVVFKYAANGDTLWQYYIQVEQGVTTAVTSLLLDEDQNLLIFGSYFDTLQNRGGLYIQKKSPTGTLIWTALHVEPDYNYGSSSVVWTGDHWVFWGRNSSSAAGGTRLLCWQVGTQGETLGAAASSLNPKIIYPVHIDQEGSLYLTLGVEYRAIKYRTSAIIDWEHLKPSPDSPAQLLSIAIDNEDNVYLAGHIRIDQSHVESILIKLNKQGNVLWEHNLISMKIYPKILRWLNNESLLAAGLGLVNPDSNLYDCAFAIYNASGFVKAGITNLQGVNNGLRDVAVDQGNLYVAGVQSFQLDTNKHFLTKYLLDGFVRTNTPNSILPSIGKLTINPNPFSSRCSIDLDYCGEPTNGMFKLYNAQGSLVFSQEAPISVGKQSIDLGSFTLLPSGMYQIVLEAGGNLYTGKAVRVP